MSIEQSNGEDPGPNNDEQETKEQYKKKGRRAFIKEAIGIGAAVIGYLIATIFHVSAG